MIKNSVIIIPNISNEDQVCDFLMQTKKVLDKHNFVYIVDFFGSQTLKDFFKKNTYGSEVKYLRPIDFLPLKRFKFVNDLNKLLYFYFLQIHLSIKHRTLKNFYIWMFFPQLINSIKLKLPNWKVIFDIVDFHTSNNSILNTILDQNKKYLLKKSDYIFVISNSLLKKYKNFVKDKNIKLKTEIKLVPQGFDSESFSKQNLKSKIIFPKGKPIIGFIGQISERLDFDLISNLVKGNLNYNFVFIGPKHHESNVPENNLHKATFAELCEQSNFFYYGKQSRNTIASMINNFDICTIPYDVSFDFNKYSYPMKMFEYFYVGKPVLTTPIKELERFSDFVKIGKNSKDWESSIRDLLSKPWPTEKILKQREIALENSWENKLEKIYEFIKK